MNIGLNGLAFESDNKGCEALSYGFLNILQEIAKKRNDIFDISIFQRCNVDRIYMFGDYKNLRCICCWPQKQSKHKLIQLYNRYRACDVVFDFTAGDSFTDIYGMKGFFMSSGLKIFVLISKTPLILGSQTYGPYNNMISKQIAKYIIGRSIKVYARDGLSCEVVKNISKKEAVQTVDVAFALNYKKSSKEHEGIRVGINPSGLLWNDVEKKTNKFKLSVDYPEYCRKLITKLLEKNIYVYLIPHVISEGNENTDNDWRVCIELKSEFPRVSLAPRFNSPSEAKSYIASMDVLTGARMHATIAALTTGVPVIPFSYSRKFEGLFGSIDYNYIINGREYETEDAINKTLLWIDQYQIMQSELNEIQKNFSRQIDTLIMEIDNVLYGLLR